VSVCKHCDQPISEADSRGSIGQLWRHVETIDGETDVQWAPEPERPDPNPNAWGHYAEPTEEL
jgi:hypothetical protein